MSEKYNEIILAFKNKGCRITEQRKNLLTIILKNPGCSCKELYYMAKQADGEIGRATVYRTVHSLEELGFVQKKSVVIC
ncbi:MAG: transcriptional repressor [Treponema sp.]|nr:transcriptional repressor [Treponema sp.]